MSDSTRNRCRSVSFGAIVSAHALVEGLVSVTAHTSPELDATGCTTSPCHV